jgi:hypothetical protein
MTMHYLVAELVFVHTPATTDEQFEAFLDSLMDELDKIGYSDADLAASLAERTAEFVIGVEDNTGGLEDVALRLLSDLRTALHAAKCHTPDWPVRSVAMRSVEENDLAIA